MSDFNEYCKVIYGWSHIDVDAIYKILLDGEYTLRNPEKLVKLDEEERADFILNSDLLTTVHGKGKKFTLFHYPWDEGTGVYFGLKLKKEQVGTFGEPQSGSLIMNEIDLSVIQKEQELLNKYTKIIGKQPTLIVLSTGY